MKKFKKLTKKEMSVTKGGGLPWWAGGILYDAAKWLVCENNDIYGRRMYENGGPGGHK